MRLDPAQALLGLTAAALAAVYVAAAAVPWWGIVPSGWSIFLTAQFSWVTIAGALLGVHLVWAWVRYGSLHGDGSTRELLVVPLALVALAVLVSVPFPTIQLNWTEAVLFGLTLPLALLGLVAGRGGLGELRVPELLRVDRI